MELPSNPFSRRAALKSIAALAAAPAVTGQSSASRDRSLDDNWRFLRGDAPGAEKPGFDDSGWAMVSVPHDWSIEDLPPHPASNGAGAVWADCNCPSRVGPFDRDLSEGKGSTGWVVGGTGWYRRLLPASAVPAGRLAELRFDGVYMNADVWINGRHLGNHPYGYTGFAYDITPYLQKDTDNVIAVRVRNEGKNSRWYSGSGIYRHVWLNVTGNVRIPQWGVWISTPDVSAASATVKLKTRVENRGPAARNVTVRARLLDGARVAATGETTQQVPAAGAEVEQTLTLPNPKLWSPDTPNLYTAEVELVEDGGMIDRTVSTFGARKIEVDAERGLRLNGTPIKLKGGCLHHDNGVLGAAAIDRAEARRVEIMKANGFNAIRTSHNPPSPAFLDACDRVGVVVIDEAFDMWQKPKNPQDYHQNFDQWWQRDVDAMVLRDRNHPSVIMWSIGNEIEERADPPGVALAQKLSERVKSLDPTRPVTAAICLFWEGGRKRPWTDSDAAFPYLDVGGYNYQWPQYEADHKRHPKRVMAGTESFPIQALDNWELVEKLPYVIGDFVWTGMDYLGESSIGNSHLVAPDAKAPERPDPGIPEGTAQEMQDFPWFNGYCGDIDIIGQKKPQSYFRDVVWGRSKLEMAVQRPVPEGKKEQLSYWGWSDELRSWTWPGSEGRALSVRVYTTGDRVRLLLNGKEVGVQPVARLKAEFSVPYAPGELKAVAMAGGKPIGELAFKTAGAPAKLRVRTDRAQIRNSRNDLAFVLVDVLDAAGNPVPDAIVPVVFAMTGPGELAGVGNANPKEMASFRQPVRNTYHGQCLAVVRPTGAGVITLNASSAGVAGGSVAIKV